MHSRCYTMHYTLCAVPNALYTIVIDVLYTIHSAWHTLHTLHCILYTQDPVHYTLCSMHYTRNTKDHKQYITHCKLGTSMHALYTPHTIHHTLYMPIPNVYRIMHSVKCMMYCIWSKVHNVRGQVHNVLCIVLCVACREHSRKYTPYTSHQTCTPYRTSNVLI